MIENERQYRITKAVAETFELALKERALETGTDNEVQPLLRQAQEDAARSQLADLRADLREYEVSLSRQDARVEGDSSVDSS